MAISATVRTAEGKFAVLPKPLAPPKKSRPFPPRPRIELPADNNHGDAPGKPGPQLARILRLIAGLSPEDRRELDLLLAPSEDESISSPFSSPQIDSISNNSQGLADYANYTGSQKGKRDALLPDKILSKIKSVADELPEVKREQFIRTTSMSFAIILAGKTPSNRTLIRREDQYRKTLEVYQTTRTVEAAKSLRSAYQNLVSKQKELGLQPQLRETDVALAFSQLKPSQAKAPTQPPEGARRGRPKLIALG